MKAPGKKKAVSPAAPRFEVISWQGAKILVADYSLGTRDEVWALTNQIRDYLEKQKPNSVNILFDVDRPYYEASHVNHWKKTLGQNDAVIRKSCFINAAPIMHLIVSSMRVYSAFTGEPMKKERGIFFKDKASALDWLSQ
jgi:hypothetical protein